MFYMREYRQQTTAGFTLIEMLVVVVMIGVISAIAAPSWQNFLDRQRMNAARNDLINVLRNAQEEAQSRQQSKRVTFSTDTSAPMTVTVLNASASTGGVTTILGGGAVSTKFSLTASTPIVFDHDGRVDISTPYVMKITNDNNQSGSSPPQSCVIVTTLLGGMKEASNDVCDSF